MIIYTILLISQLLLLGLRATGIISGSWFITLIPLWTGIMAGCILVVIYIIIPWIDLKQFSKSIKKDK